MQESIDQPPTDPGAFQGQPATRINAEPESREQRVVVITDASSMGEPIAPEVTPIAREQTAGMGPDQARAKLDAIRKGVDPSPWQEAWTSAGHPAHSDAVSLMAELHRIAAGESPAQGSEPTDQGEQPGKIGSADRYEFKADPAVREGLAASMTSALDSLTIDHFGGEAVRQELVRTADVFAQAGLDGDDARDMFGRYVMASQRDHLRTDETDAEAFAATEAELSAQWGEQYDAKLAAARRAADKFGLTDVILRTGLGNDAQVLRTLAKAGERLMRAA